MGENAQFVLIFVFYLDDTSDESDSNMITKDMLVEAARMISAKKNYDPPSALGVGLQNAGEEKIASTYVFFFCLG